MPPKCERQTVGRGDIRRQLRTWASVFDSIFTGFRIIRQQDRVERSLGAFVYVTIVCVHSNDCLKRNKRVFFHVKTIRDVPILGDKLLSLCEIAFRHSCRCEHHFVNNCLYQRLLNA